MIFDIHSHLIPKVDDGSKSIAESIKMLQILKGEGVDNVLATPHFYPDSNSLETFFNNRKIASDALKISLDREGLPNVYLGCELYYTRGMADFASLANLRIENTPYILLELPYGGFSRNTLDDILNFSINFNLIPIFAHLERFGLFRGFDQAVDFVASGNALAQVNASSFFDNRLKKYAAKLAKKDLISFIGSDFHTPANPPQVRKSLAHIASVFPQSYKRINDSGEMLLNAIHNK